MKYQGRVSVNRLNMVSERQRAEYLYLGYGMDAPYDKVFAVLTPKERNEIVHHMQFDFGIDMKRGEEIARLIKEGKLKDVKIYFGKIPRKKLNKFVMKYYQG